MPIADPVALNLHELAIPSVAPDLVGLLLDSLVRLGHECNDEVQQNDDADDNEKQLLGNGRYDEYRAAIRRSVKLNEIADRETLRAGK